jgi:Mg-chelatase subunit ChlD
MVLLESDLEENFGIPVGAKDKVAKHDLYDWLCKARDLRHRQYCQNVESSLIAATERDKNTHKYFDALLGGDELRAQSLFKELYQSMKKRPLPKDMFLDLAFVIDVTGSMGPYANATAATVGGLIEGGSSIVAKLKLKFPEMDIKLRVATMGFRDIDDQANQFQESTWRGGGHFTENLQDAVRFVQSTTANPSGGFDLAEDLLGAIDRCISWNVSDDWTAPIKCIMLLTDAPAHGFVPPCSSNVANGDSYSVRHPRGLSAEAVINRLHSKSIDLFFCSYNPAATSRTEEQLSQFYLEHPDNKEEREITVVPMVAKNGRQQQQTSALLGGHGKHLIFVLDESGSMAHNWAGVVVAYRQYVKRCLQNQRDSDLVSVVQFGSGARTTVQQQPISKAPDDLSFLGSGTIFAPAALEASRLAVATPPSHVPAIVFMSDGAAGDAPAAASTFSSLNQQIKCRFGDDLELHVIAFGSNASRQQLEQIAGASRNGKVHMSADTADLSNIFVDIAGGQDVTGVLEAEIGKRISEAVMDKLCLEYMS